MKNKFLLLMSALTIMLPKSDFAQAPVLGVSGDFVLFTTVGAVSNTGLSHLTGHVGTNSGVSSGFGNVDGVMHDNDGVSAAAAADLTLAYNQLNAAVPTFFPAPLLGGGQILAPGVYSIAGPSTLDLDLTLDGAGDPNAVFILQVNGSFSANTNAKVKLINSAQACNVFWKVEGLVSLGAGVSMKGTIVANNAGINMNTNDTLEGRALSTAGAITLDGTLAYIPSGCGSAVLTGPIAPNFGSAFCYTIFSSDGPVTNVGVTNVTGDVGSNLGSTTGYNPLLVVGTIHTVPDGSTASAASDLGVAYNYMNLLPYDIELLYPAQFGNNLVLTPHTYLMNAAASFTDTLYLNAQGNVNAVFVILINGALTTSTYSNVVLINGAQSKNVFWKVEGAVSINDYSKFRGSIIANNGAINLATGVMLDGRALSTTGAVSTAAIDAVMTAGCGMTSSPLIITDPNDQMVCSGDSATFTVVATGAGLTYQWRRGSVNLIDGGNISGATTSVLTIAPATAADAATDYNVIVMGSSMPNDTSANASLTITNGASIVLQPNDMNVCPGDSAGFSVSATGPLLTYQWRRGTTNLIDGGNISGATTSILSVNPSSVLDTAFNYNVIVFSACGNDTSENAALNFSVAVAIVSQPSDTIACVNDSITLSVSATGSGLTYQWRKGLVNMINGGNISGATSSTLVIDPATVADSGTDYNVIVSGSCGTSDTSANASVQINPLPVANTGSNSPVCTGNTIFLTSDSLSGATYSWTSAAGYSSSLQDPSILNATLSDGGIYTLVVTANGCNSAPSTVVVTVGDCPADLSVTKTVSNTTPFIGSTVVFTITATNNGPSEATGVEVLEVIQTGFLFISYSSTAGTYDPATGIWTIDTLSNGESEVLTITVQVLESGNYTNTATVFGSGTDSDLVNNSSFVEIFPTDFNIPEGFSPNGDGINDVFFIRGLSNYPENTFTIFNRWGNLVYEKTPYQNDWDGTNTGGTSVGGSKLPVGIYFYVLDLGDGTEIFKGTIYLNH